MILVERPSVVVQERRSTAVVRSSASARPVVQHRVAASPIAVREARSVVQTRDARPRLQLAGGNQGPPGRDGAGSAATVDATYSAPFAAGQIAYLAADLAYPVTRAMPQSILNQLAVVTLAGLAGAVSAVLLNGVAASPVSLPAGIVYLGDDGLPTGVDNESANYIPIGFTDGGFDYYFQPQQRFARS